MEELFGAKEQSHETAEILQKDEEKQHLNKMKLQSAQITRWRSLQVSSPVANYSPSMSFQGQAKKVLHVNTHIENPPVIPFLALSRSGSQSGSVARPAGNPKSMNDIQQALCRHVVQML